MSSFFSVPGAQKKRKRNHDGPASKRPGRPRPAKPQTAPKTKVNRDDEISGSESESEAADHGDASPSDSDESERDETVAQKRLRLASQYLSRVREEVEATGWDAEQIVRNVPIIYGVRSKLRKQP
jgi:ribosomal RNA-processing protein 9